MAKLTVYSKKTCKTCQKALAFLDQHHIIYDLKNIETEPPSRDVLEEAIDEKNLKASLNPRSTIYKEKQLGAATLSKAETIDLMLTDPNLIKRPLIVHPSQDKPYQGFDETSLNDYLNA